MALVKFSSCPGGASNPNCEDDDMNAVLSWRCRAGTYYNCKVQAEHWFVVGARSTVVAHGEAPGLPALPEPCTALGRLRLAVAL